MYCVSCLICGDFWDVHKPPISYLQFRCLEGIEEERTLIDCACVCVRVGGGSAIEKNSYEFAGTNGGSTTLRLPICCCFKKPHVSRSFGSFSDLFFTLQGSKLFRALQSAVSGHSDFRPRKTKTKQRRCFAVHHILTPQQRSLHQVRHVLFVILQK